LPNILRSRRRCVKEEGSEEMGLTEVHLKVFIDLALQNALTKTCPKKFNNHYKKALKDINNFALNRGWGNIIF